MAISQKGLTLDEFLAWPEAKPALELIEGVAAQKVSPNLHHGALQYEAAELFNRFGRPRKLARAFPELRTSFAGSSPVLDVSVYRAE